MLNELICSKKISLYLLYRVFSGQYHTTTCINTTCTQRVNMAPLYFRGRRLLFCQISLGYAFGVVSTFLIIRLGNLNSPVSMTSENTVPDLNRPDNFNPGKVPALISFYVIISSNSSSRGRNNNLKTAMFLLCQLPVIYRFYLSP